MTKTIQQNNKELHQCGECGFRYENKEWAEKCEAWCKEHQSCNIEITAHSTDAQGGERSRTTHAIPPASPSESEAGQEDESKKDELKPEDIKFLTKLFYGLIGIVSSLAFFLVLYWILRLDSAITNVITNTYSTPLYFWPYVILTFGAIILFGVNIFVH